MIHEQLQTLREMLAANRQPVDRAEQNAHPRGWNDALDFVERCMKNLADTAAAQSRNPS